MSCGCRGVGGGVKGGLRVWGFEGVGDGVWVGVAGMQGCRGMGVWGSGAGECGGVVVEGSSGYT